jgi:Tfp pilus assembly protein PilV
MESTAGRQDRPGPLEVAATRIRAVKMLLNRTRSEAGFTIIEIMVAIFVLLLGLLGAVTMIDSANGITANNKGREGAFNLTREIVEAARQVDYDTLTAANAQTTLQAVSGLADASGAAGWQLIRRGITYTVQVTACTYDDPKDGGRSTSDTGSYCAGSATQVNPATTSNCPAKNPDPPCVDTQPDDFRKLIIASQWTISANTRNSTQTALIVNPSGGRGPRISNVTKVPALTSPANTVGPTTALQPCTEAGHSGSNCITYTVTTASSAGTVQWSSSDGTSNGQATAAGTNTWRFQYDLGTAGAVGAVLDGNYTISIQAFSSTGIAGDLNAQTLVVNRSIPSEPRQFAGGRNSRNGIIVDFNWIRNQETDIVGYRVYLVNASPDWQNVGGDPPDTLVCGSAATPLNSTSCFDPSPAASGALTYYIKAVDKDVNGNLRESTGGLSAQIDTLSTTTPAPTWPGGTTLSATLTNGVPVLTWNNAATPNAGRTIIFYRVYRDPGNVVNPSYSDRYDTNGGTSLTYKDTNFGATTSHTYVVTAVDDTFSESQPIGPAVSP